MGAGIRPVGKYFHGICLRQINFPMGELAMTKDTGLLLILLLFVLLVVVLLVLE